MTDDPLALFAEATRAWFLRALGAPTPVQVRGWAAVAAGRHTLMAAPTGSGKTLARVPVVHRSARAQPRPGTGRLRLADQGARVRHRAHLRAPLARSLADHGRRATGDTPARNANASQGARSHPDHDAGVAVPRAAWPRARAVARRRDRHHRRDPRARADKRGIHLAVSLDGCAWSPAASTTYRVVCDETSLSKSLDIWAATATSRLSSIDPPALDLEIVVPAADMAAPVAPATATRRAHASVVSPAAAYVALITWLLELILAHR